MKKHATRYDTVGRWIPPADLDAVSMETAAKSLFGKGGSAEAARQRMLERRGLVVGKDEPAADRRQALIERKQK